MKASKIQKNEVKSHAPKIEQLPRPYHATQTPKQNKTKKNSYN